MVSVMIGEFLRILIYEKNITYIWNRRERVAGGIFSEDCAGFVGEVSFRGNRGAESGEAEDICQEMGASGLLFTG